MRNRSKRGYRKNFNDRNGNRGDNPRESEVFLLHKNVKVLQRHYHTIGRIEIPKINRESISGWAEIGNLSFSDIEFDLLFGETRRGKVSRIDETSVVSSSEGE